MNSLPTEAYQCKGCFSEIHPPVSDVNFSNNISMLRVRVNIKKTEHDTTFDISQLLTPIWVGFLGVRFEVGGKITPCLKLVRIILEISNLARKYKTICSFRKYTFQYLAPPILLIPAFFCRKLAFFLQKGTLLCQIFFSSVFSFCKTRLLLLKA